MVKDTKVTLKDTNKTKPVKPSVKKDSEKKAVASNKESTKATITIKQVKSSIRRPQDQTDTLIGLGLNKINRVSTLQNTSSVMGMIKKVNHLIKILN